MAVCESTRAPVASERVLPPKTRLIPLREACAILGVCGNTLRRWSTGPDAVLQCYRLGAWGQRRWDRKEIESYATGDETQSSTKVCLVYCRVSTHSQSATMKNGKENESDLDRQVERMKAEAHKRYPDLPQRIYKETGSSLCFTRKIMNRLLKEILEDKWNGSILLVENKDRLFRWGAELWHIICEAKNIDIIYTAQEEISDTESFTSDVLAIIHHFSTKLYSSRAAERKRKVVSSEAIQRGKELLDAGYTLVQISETLESEGFRTSTGEPIRYEVIRRVIYRQRLALDVIQPKRDNSAVEWKKAFIKTDNNGALLPIPLSYEHYKKWCASQNKPLLSRKRFSQSCAIPYEQHWIPSAKGKVSYWRGVSVEGIHFQIESTVRQEKHEREAAVVKEFLKTAPESPISFRQMRDLYNTWCRKNGISPLSKESLRKRRLFPKEMLIQHWNCR